MLCHFSLSPSFLVSSPIFLIIIHCIFLSAHTDKKKLNEKERESLWGGLRAILHAIIKKKVSTCLAQGKIKREREREGQRKSEWEWRKCQQQRNCNNRDDNDDNSMSWMHGACVWRTSFLLIQFSALFAATRNDHYDKFFFHLCVFAFRSTIQSKSISAFWVTHFCV